MNKSKKWNSFFKLFGFNKKTYKILFPNNFIDFWSITVKPYIKNSKELSLKLLLFLKIAFEIITKTILKITIKNIIIIIVIFLIKTNFCFLQIVNKSCYPN